MINPMYIQEKLVSHGNSVEYVYCKKTPMIDLHKFLIQITDSEDEVLTVWSSKHVGKKLFIDIQGGTEKLGKEKAAFIEETVKEAVIHTPNNRMPHLFDPIQFISKNFVQENNFELSEERIDEQFDFSTLSLMNKKTDEAMSFYGFTIPSNNKESVVASLFKKLPSVFSVEKVKDKNIIKFYKHGDSLKEEFKKLKDVKDKLKDIGIDVEIASIYGVIVFAMLRVPDKIISILNRDTGENASAMLMNQINIAAINEILISFL